MIFVSYFFFHSAFFLSYLFNKKINNYDIPSGLKLHKEKTITSAGLFPFILLSIFCIFLFYLHYENLFLKSSELPFFLIIPICILFLTIISFLDDLKSLSIQFRLISQFCVVFFSIAALPVNVGLGFQTPIFNGLINIKIDLFFVIILWVYFINATNFYDGADGLLGLQLINFGFSYYLIFNDLKIYLISEISLLILFIGISFLFFNFSRKYKMFLGDTGSVVTGYLFGFLTIRLISEGYYIAPLLISFTIVFDIFTSLLFRLFKKKSIFVRHNEFIFKFIIKKYSLNIYLFGFIIIQSILSFFAINSI